MRIRVSTGALAPAAGPLWGRFLGAAVIIIFNTSKEHDLKKRGI